VAGDRGADVQLWTTGAGICPAFHAAKSRTAGLCLGGDVGRLHTSGFGFATSVAGRLWFADAVLALEVRQRIVAGLFAELGARAVVPLLRARAVYATPSGDIEVYRPWPVAAVAHLGAGYAFR
jgi:hypothetical protein